MPGTALSSLLIPSGLTRTNVHPIQKRPVCSSRASNFLDSLAACMALIEEGCKQATYGIAWEQGTLNFRVFKSVGTANLEDPEGEVTGINLGIGLVVPLSHIRGSFRDFGGESIEESTGYGVVQLTDITTSSGRQGRSGSVNVGPSVAATRLRTVTTFYGCPR